MSGFGGLFMIVRRSLRQHALSTAVTVLSVALGIGLVMSVFSLSTQTQAAFTGGPIGFDAVLGARGSQLQLVLNTVFHLETSPGNLPWRYYQSIAKRPGVKLAIPYAVGDNYFGYRIVGTTPEMFTEFEYRKGEKLTPRDGGRAFDPAYMEAVVGATVAREIGLVEGDTLNPYHGVSFDESQQHREVYTVVGVLEPSNSPSDRVIWIPIDGVFRMEGHVLRGDGGRKEYKPQEDAEIPDQFKEVSAVMLTFDAKRTGVFLDQIINKQGKEATLAWPIPGILMSFFEKMGWMTRILELVAYLVVVVASASILASIYNTMNERRREFAILRALGARKGTVFSVIVLEAVVIAALGCLVGYAVYFAIMATAGWLVRDVTGVVLDLAAFHPALVWTPLGMIVLGGLSGLLPAFKAYSTDVASNLLPTS